MIVPVQPPLEGIAATRFRALARQLMQAQQKRYSADFSSVCANELQWSCDNAHLNGCRDVYQAVMRVLVDLARLNWTIQEDRFGIELQAPDFLPRAGLGMDEIRRSNRAVREELAPLRQAQLQNPACGEFI